MNEIIAGGKNISGKIFWNYVKDLIRSTGAKNEQLVNNIIKQSILLKNPRLSQTTKI